MKIIEIKSGQGGINIEADVINKTEIREFNKFGKPLKVATAIIRDESGEAQLSLWNQETDKINQGDRIKLTNGFAKDYQGKLQLTVGKFGKLEIIGKAANVEADTRTNVQEEEAEIESESSDLEEEW